MALIDWIPKFIQQVIARPARYKVTSEEYNALFNLVIEQGDHNTAAIQNLRDEFATKLAIATAEAVFATKVEIQGLVVGALPAGSVTPAMLSFDPVTEAELVTALDAFDGGTGTILDISEMTGTSKNDGYASAGTCLYASTSAVAVVELARAETDRIKLGLQSVILRMRSSNNTNATDTIKIEIFKKNVSAGWDTQGSWTFKPTVFDNTTDYENLYIPFEYKGGQATDSMIRIVVSLLTNAVAMELALDTITVTPSTIAVVDK